MPPTQSYSSGIFPELIVTSNREHCYRPEKCKQRLRLAPPRLQARTHEQTHKIRFGKPGLRSEPPRQSGAHPRSKLAATNKPDRASGSAAADKLRTLAGALLGTIGSGVEGTNGKEPQDIG